MCIYALHVCVCIYICIYVCDIYTVALPNLAWLCLVQLITANKPCRTWPGTPLSHPPECPTGSPRPSAPPSRGQTC